MKYLIDHDLHLHSQLSSCSSHPEQTTDALISYAKRLGLKHICLTDHFWDSAVSGASPWYKPQDFEHISKALPLPRSEGVRFDFGCETDLDRHLTLGASSERLNSFDFIIIPTSHLHMKGFTIDENAASVNERAKIYMERNHAILDMPLPFEKIGLAHFTCTLLAKNCEGSRDDIMNAITNSEYYEFFERVSAVGMGVELNAPLSDASCEAALRPYKIAKECGCKFYLGSDAHTPEDLTGAHARFVAMTEALSLTEDDKFAFVAR